MRYVLTIIAVALVAVMSAALVAPMLIDWSAHRAEIEARLRAITGANVSLTGPVEVRLLPTPYLALGAGSLSAPGPDGPKLSFDSARLELALVALTSGQIRFSDISLDKPVLTIAARRRRRAAVAGAAAGATAVDRRRPSDRAGRAGAGRRRQRTRVGDRRRRHRRRRSVSRRACPSQPASFPAPTARRSSSGSLRKSRGRTGRRSASRWTPGRAGRPASSKACSKATPAGALAGLRLAGTATLTGTAPGENEPTPWRVAGPMTVDLARAVLRGAEFRLGPEERAIRATGDATLAFGSPPRLSIDLKAKQANVDALMRRKGEDGVAPARAVTLLSRIAAAALEGRQGRIAIDARASAEPIILGAQTLPDATVALRAEPGAPLHLRFSLGLPGQSRIAGEGDLDAGAAAKFRGDIDFSSPDFALLRDWASLGAPESAARVAAFGEALAYRSAALTGEVEASATRLSGRNLKLTLDRTTLTGSLAFASPAGGEARPPRPRPRNRFARRRHAAEPRRRKNDRRHGPFDFARGRLAAYRPRRRNGGRQRPGGAEDGQERAERHARAPERRRTGRRLARHRRARWVATRLRRPAICGPTGCAISPPWFRVSRRANGAGFWSIGRTRFRRRR